MFSVIGGKPSHKGKVVFCHLFFVGKDIILLGGNGGGFTLINRFAFVEVFFLLGIGVIDPDDRGIFAVFAYAVIHRKGSLKGEVFKKIEFTIYIARQTVIQTFVVIGSCFDIDKRIPHLGTLEVRHYI